MSITACFNLLEKHFEAVTRVYNLNLKISVTVLRLREGALTGHMKKIKKMSHHAAIWTQTSFLYLIFWSFFACERRRGGRNHHVKVHLRNLSQQHLHFFKFDVEVFHFNPPPKKVEKSLLCFGSFDVQIHPNTVLFLDYLLPVILL